MAELFVYTVLALLLAFVFFMYLMLRRTVASFKEGVSQGDDRT